MTEGDGRESDTQHNNDYLYSDAPAPGSPNASNVRAYTRQYQYDKIGNVQQVKQLGTNGFTRNFVYNTGVNTLQKIEDGSNVNIQSFTYDDVGNQITAGTTRNYVWNAANELITYYNQAGSSDPTIFAQYNYSGGNRVSKMVRTGSAGSPIYERVIYIDGIFEYHVLENGTTYEKNYVHIMDDKSRIAMVRIGDQFPDDITNAVTYNLEDQIGSSTVRLNTSGGVIDKEEYYPFGDSALRTFSKKRYRYVGKEKDLESGLYYYGARYYAAWTCRFISIDPLAADYAHLTPYNNAGNKVINSIDIDGMQGENETKTPAAVQGAVQELTGTGGGQGNNLDVNQTINIKNDKSISISGNKLFHTVQEGESLSSLSKKYNVSKQSIIDANSVDGGHNTWNEKDRSNLWIYTGEIFVIPSKSLNSEYSMGDDIEIKDEGVITVKEYGFSKSDDLPMTNVVLEFQNKDKGNNQYYWYQTINTNEWHDFNFKSYIGEGIEVEGVVDINTSTDPSKTNLLDDTVGRLPKGYRVFFIAETSLIKKDKDGNISILKTFKWGFEIKPGSQGSSFGLNSVKASDKHVQAVKNNEKRSLSNKNLNQFIKK